ncbi:YTH domain-containing protein 1 isoform X2 [Lingula anatina]|uniref:YTH domain-containing protein 1 isoform X2 n=1 Tax=Lingula anatina TaxID=7574 RepID=A0A1S3JBT9_LINAN|nr:YTH domain-containing protein 1 isoform X2 [Lingula anatina]|eukprot:XP_013407349.1 YTH domain-containing protein 1 isoform X2 [Lingula anatina]
MSEEAVEHKDSEGDAAVLDDILETTVDDDFPAEEHVEKKPGRKTRNKKVRPVKAPAKGRGKGTKRNAKPTEPEDTPELEDETIDEEEQLKEMEKRRKELERMNAEKEREVKRLKREEKALKEANDKDESDGKVNASSAEEEKADDNPEYDIRSEAGSSAHGSVASGSGEESDGEETGQQGQNKRSSRSISPIEWEANQRPSRSRSKSGSGSGSRSRSRSASRERRSSAERREYQHKLRHIFREATYFIIKSNNHENVALAKAKGVWSTPPQNEFRINKAYRESRNVILIFSVRESGKFQGYARVASESDKDHPPIRWVLPPGLSAKALSGVFKLDWVTRRDLPFTKTAHLLNPWNDNKPVKIGRDGQPVEPRCGEALCRMFPADEAIDISAITRKAKAKGPAKFSRPPPRESFPRRGISPRRRPSRRESYEYEPRPKRGRLDMGRDPGRDAYRRDRPSPRTYAGVRKETFINGSYHDYMREFQHRAPPMPPMTGQWIPAPMPYGEHMPPYHHPYDRRDTYAPPSEYGLPSSSRRSNEKRYDREVDDFLRRTHRGSSRERRHRDSRR